MSKHLDPNEITPEIDAVSADIADFTVGFLKLTIANGREDAILCGSGAFVRTGSIFGILTAAHVLRNLPARGQVGIVRFARTEVPAAHETINMEYTEKLIIAEGNNTVVGPDIGFLKLSDIDVQALQSRSTFFNLDKRKNIALERDIHNFSGFDGISGVIADWTTEQLTFHKKPRQLDIKAMFGIGIVTKKIEFERYENIEFEVKYEKPFTTPDSFGGMSGGALWRVNATMNKNGKLTVENKNIYGLAFYQTEVVDGVRNIICHGPRTIYELALNSIKSRWE